MILAARSPLDDTRVLRENHREIFQEIEDENPFFPEMTYRRQREVVMAKVAEFKERIVLIDETQGPEFEPAQEEETDNEQQPDANE